LPEFIEADIEKAGDYLEARQRTSIAAFPDVGGDWLGGSGLRFSVPVET
jgi:hypothetical protein